MYLCMHACNLYKCTHIHTHIHTHNLTWQPCKYPQTTCVHERNTCLYIHTHMSTFTHTNIHTHIYTHEHSPVTALRLPAKHMPVSHGATCPRRLCVHAYNNIPHFHDYKFNHTWLFVKTHALLTRRHVSPQLVYTHLIKSLSSMNSYLIIIGQMQKTCSSHTVSQPRVYAHM